MIPVILISPSIHPPSRRVADGRIASKAGSMHSSGCGILAIKDMKVGQDTRRPAGKVNQGTLGFPRFLVVITWATFFANTGPTKRQTLHQLRAKQKLTTPACLKRNSGKGGGLSIAHLYVGGTAPD